MVFDFYFDGVTVKTGNKEMLKRKKEKYVKNNITINQHVKRAAKILFPCNVSSHEKVDVVLKGQYHAIFSNTLKIEKTLFGIAAKP